MPSLTPYHDVRVPRQEPDEPLEAGHHARQALQQAPRGLVLIRTHSLHLELASTPNPILTRVYSSIARINCTTARINDPNARDPMWYRNAR